MLSGFHSTQKLFSSLSYNFNLYEVYNPELFQYIYTTAQIYYQISEHDFNKKAGICKQSTYLPNFPHSGNQESILSLSICLFWTFHIYGTTIFCELLSSFTQYAFRVLPFNSMYQYSILFLRLCCRYTTFLISWQTLGCFLWAITEIVVMNAHVQNFV